MSETWSSINDVDLYVPDNYNLVSNFFRTNSIRGGVSIFVKNEYKFSNFTIPCNIEKAFECCCCYFKVNKSYIVLICIYRSPSASAQLFLDQLDQCLSLLFTKFGHSSSYILGGDFNINFLSANMDTNLLFDVLGSYGFCLSYDSPTRIQGTCCSGIDYLISNIPRKNHNSQVVHSNISDHFHQVLSVDKCLLGFTAPKPTGKIRKRNFSNFTIAKFQAALSNIPRDGCFYSLFLEFFDVYFPSKIVKIKNSPNISNSKSIFLSNFSQSLREWHDFLKCNNLPLSTEYKNKCNEFKLCVIQNRISNNSNLIALSKNVSKATWNLINSKIKKTSSPENIKLMIDNHLVSDPEEVANCFLDTFLPDDHINSDDSSTQNTSFSTSTNQMILFPTDPEEVKSIILNLPNSTSVGPDEIPTSLFKSCVDQICLPISDLINEIFATGTFPDAFKIAKIIPLYKKGSKLDPSNYRPLVIQNIFSKIVEKVFTVRLVNYLVKFKLINSSQYAYLKGKSVELAIYNFLNAIYDSLENSKDCIGIFYDFSKAFDLVCHILLYHKLSALGVNGAPLAFIKSYLSDRKYFVQLRQTDAEGNVTDHKSSERVWNRGVPQGSNLGPYLFLVMVNDLPSHLQSELLSMFAAEIELTMYADDVNSIVSHKNFAHLETICNFSINLMQIWCKNNDLKLNSSKTNFIQFKSVYNKFGNPPPNLILNEASVTSSDSCVFLGLRLNKHLDWSDHVDHLSSRIRSGCFSLGRLRGEVTIETLKSVYYAHIYSHIKNNIIFWGHSSIATRIFILQKRAIRTIFGVPARHSCVSLYTEFDVLTLPGIYIYECSMFVKKNLDLFKKNCDTHCYSTRNSKKLSVFQHSTATYEKSPCYRLVHIYNKLPDNIKNITSIPIFKKRLFAFLMDLNLYKVGDFFE